ncbi:NAD(P)-binding protein [Ascodesmis nigricans]|uniref:NAD(P)-binding protein n=1 Tax=Ascodesmis nigricans TaxID=341454 RepID=A0A4S2MYP9_9PEZI|nr:NAD(P)-binding protein [Ascodesmis nigricans]
MTSAFRLDGKTAIITGGSRGLGLYAAEGLLDAGVTTVIITSRKAAACDEAVTFLKGKFPKANIFAIPADLSKASEVTRFIAGVKAAGISKVHICLANAGATWGAPFDTFPDSGFEKVFDLNVRSVFNLIRECAPLLEAAAVPGDPARVITVGSVAGIGIGNIGANATYSYAASKAAVHHLSKHLAVALGPRGILVNAIAPGFFVTKMAAGLIDKSGGEAALGKSTPNGRLGQPDDIAGVVTFLSSKAASHVNGVVIPIDGGKHLLAGFDDAKAKM